jgi:hypothetical protein
MAVFIRMMMNQARIRNVLEDVSGTFLPQAESSDDEESASESEDIRTPQEEVVDTSESMEEDVIALDDDPIND